MHSHDGQTPYWPHPAHPQLPPRTVAHAGSGRRKPPTALIVGLALVPFALVATCVGVLFGSWRGAAERAELTLKACAPSGEVETCARVTGTEDDAKALEGIRTAVAQLDRDFGAFVSLSARGTCTHVGGASTRQELSADVSFERATTPMYFRWEDDELVAFAPDAIPARCK